MGPQGVWKNPSAPNFFSLLMKIDHTFTMVKTIFKEQGKFHNM